MKPNTNNVMFLIGAIISMLFLCLVISVGFMAIIKLIIESLRYEVDVATMSIA